MNQLTIEQQVQEEQYIFPYHYLSLQSELHRRLLHRHYLSELARVVECLGPFTGQRHLDVGCGDGRLCYELRGKAVEYHGIDMSEAAIKFARTFNPTGAFVVGDVGGTELGDGYQSASMIQVLEHIPPDRVPAFVGALGGVLLPNAKLVVTVPSVNLRLSEKHFQHFTPERLVTVLGRHFEPVVIEGHICAQAWKRFSLLTTMASVAWPLRGRLQIARWVVQYVERYLDRSIRCEPQCAHTILAVFKRTAV